MCCRGGSLGEKAEGREGLEDRREDPCDGSIYFTKVCPGKDSWKG